MATDLALSAEETVFVLNAISDRIDLLEELIDGNYGEAVDTTDWLEEQKTLAAVYDRVFYAQHPDFSGEENE